MSSIKLLAKETRRLRALVEVSGDHGVFNYRANIKLMVARRRLALLIKEEIKKDLTFRH